MLSIHLHNVLFYSYHGVHEEEKILGGNFEVNVTARFMPSSLPVKQLDDTVNYVSIYSLIKARMDRPTELLETIVTEVAAEILDQFRKVEEVDVSIKKVNPPIVSFQGSVGVGYHLKREQ